MSSGKQWMGVGLCMAMVPWTASAASCTRHIYNNSNQPWTFEAQTDQGNVHFSGAVCDGQTNGSCKVPANTTLSIQYTFSQNDSQGYWIITDHNGAVKKFGYTGQVGACPSIGHSGNTGGVAVNDPANGDLHAWNGQW